MRDRRVKNQWIILAVIMGLLVMTPKIYAVTLDGFDVLYQGRFYNPDEDTTTYTYLVKGNSMPPALSHFIVGLPFCDFDPMVTQYYPDHDVELGIDPKTGIDGIKWDIGLEPEESRVYSFTLLGEYGEDLADVAVKAGRFSDTGQVMGPSCNLAPPELHMISGYVFFDANLNGQLDETSFFKNVHVYLYDGGDTLIGIYLTDSDGYYNFIDLPPGVYSVEMPASTPENDANEFLYLFMYQTTPMHYDINLSDADSTDNHFGFGYVRPSTFNSLDTPAQSSTGQAVETTR